MRADRTRRQAAAWRITDIAPDFRLLDTWVPPVIGGAGDFDDFLAVMAAIDPASGSVASRLLFAVRFRLGEWLGWDRGGSRPIPGCQESTLRARLPADLRGSAARVPTLADGIREAAGGFQPVYRTTDEVALEISNATVHGVLHLGWRREAGDVHRPQLSVYVKPRGRLGELYLRLIDPFRHTVVYPALMRQIGRAWAGRTVGHRDPGPAGAGAGGAP